MGDLAIRIVIARWPVKARSPVKESDKNHSESESRYLGTRTTVQDSQSCWTVSLDVRKDSAGSEAAGG
jgi:hypothetical protein